MTALQRYLCKLLGCSSSIPAAGAQAFRFWVNPQSYMEGNKMRLTNEQQVVVTVAPKTAAGRDAPVDGDVVFASSDDSVATVTPGDDGKSATVTAVAPGIAQITARFDADLGEGTREIEASGALEVVDAEAATAEIVFGEPTLKP